MCQLSAWPTIQATHLHKEGAVSDSTLWWVLAGLAISAELLTGTFHLLMLALGLAAGAAAAHMGLPLSGQLVCAALVGAGAVAVLQKIRPRPLRSSPPEANADVNLDIGQTVQIGAWSSDQVTQASYRGAMWTVELIAPETGGQPSPGLYRIREVVGNRLRVVPA